MSGLPKDAPSRQGRAAPARPPRDRRLGILGLDQTSVFVSHVVGYGWHTRPTGHNTPVGY
jgi:hypothetical protein